MSAAARLAAGAAALWAVMAPPAVALSCLKPEVAASYWMAAESETAYVVLWGEFDFVPGADPAPPPPGVIERTPAEPVIAAFSGRSLAADGFTAVHSGPVILAPECLASWCGGFPEPGQALVFAEVTGTGAYRVTLGPCGGWFFADPREADIRRVETCHRGGPCTPEGPAQ